jgi:hypothetical protein
VARGATWRREVGRALAQLVGGRWLASAQPQRARLSGARRRTIGAEIEEGGGR